MNGPEPPFGRLHQLFSNGTSSGSNSQSGRGAAMSANNTIDFWFTVGSTYTYLTVSRLHKVEAASGIRFRWRPFNARAIMQEMNNVPFATKPIKLAYMWRDVERRASKYALPIKVPAPYPLKNFDLASRIAVLGEMEGGVRTMCGPAIIAGLSRAKRLAQSPISRKVCARSARIRNASLRRQTQSPSDAPMTTTPARPDG